MSLKSKFKKAIGKGGFVRKVVLPTPEKLAIVGAVLGGSALAKGVESEGSFMKSEKSFGGLFKNAKAKKYNNNLYSEAVSSKNASFKINDTSIVDSFVKDQKERFGGLVKMMPDALSDEIDTKVKGLFSEKEVQKRGFNPLWLSPLLLFV